ncbi:MAG: hypothetical protein WKF83_08830 [Nocardioidaceae bacterium]
MAGRDGHQRQDHHRPDARRHARRRRPALGRRRQHRHADRRRPSWTPSRTTSSRSSCPASSCTGAAPWPPRLRWSSTSPTTTSTGTATQAAYRLAKGRVYENTALACVYNVEDAVTEQLVRDADVAEGCRAIGFTLGPPAVGMVGIVDGIIADRAFVPERSTSAAELGTVADIDAATPEPPHRTTSPTPSRLRRWRAPTASPSPPCATGCARSVRTPTGSRSSRTSTTWRTSTTPRRPTPTRHWRHFAAYDQSVWVAGGLAKGARFDDLVTAVRDRLRAAVLIGTDRGLIADALAPTRARRPRHRAADRPRLTSWTVSWTRRHGSPDPATPCCSLQGAPPWTMFSDYAARGDAFAAAVHRFGRNRT